MQGVFVSDPDHHPYPRPPCVPRLAPSSLSRLSCHSDPYPEILSSVAYFVDGKDLFPCAPSGSPAIRNLIVPSDLIGAWLDRSESADSRGFVEHRSTSSGY